MSESAADSIDIAIVGMAGRFPGTDDPDRLWSRILAGDDCLVTLDDPPTSSAHGHWVNRTGIVPDVDRFEPEFFSIGPRDAAIMDPQHRLMLECAWEALESAAIVPERFDGAIGVFAGSGANTYLINNLLTNPDLVDQLGWFLLRHTGNDKDFLATTVSYRLGLHGPSINVQTACSTSLVAVHLAAQSLLGFECDLALAGGVTLEFPHGVGYAYREGEILSPTGRCRAFDAASDGTVLTGGAGVVALRRLPDAIASGDPVLAVIKGSAVNNDGARKVSYLAPSVDGHADVVREALAVADVHPDTIELLEAHGTGTAVGDPIEFAALSEAFRDSTRQGGCRLTSTKPNIGHLDTAAGTASLIKVVQALRHRVLPPLANHTAPSPLIDLSDSPFELSGVAKAWESTGPHRAGVSSLGVGGTNAHVIVEEAPRRRQGEPGPTGQILALSARSRASLDRMTDRLASFIEQSPDVDVADIAHTLATGRRAMQMRRVVAVTGRHEAPGELRAAMRTRPIEADGGAPRVAFAFPGGGSQYVGMGHGLDARFATFHETRRRAIEIAGDLGVDLRNVFDPHVPPSDLERPTASLPAVFVTSLALARQWMAWGVEPDVMIGHSLGEYVAAHLAGVFSLEGALELVLTRARLMEQASGDAAMLVVPQAAAELERTLPPSLSLAVVNTDDECVVAGPAAPISELATRLAAVGIECVRLPLVAAAHSSLLDPVLGEFLTAVRRTPLRAPERPYLSNLSGNLATAAQATDPQYWVDHLRGTVRFADCLRTIAGDEAPVLVELGPGRTLGSYARRSGTTTRTVAALRHPDDERDDTRYTLGAFAEMWAHGVDVDLDQLTDAPGGSPRGRISLPTYPFERQRYWIDPGTGSHGTGVGPDTSAAGPNIERIADLDAMGSVSTWAPLSLDPPFPAIEAWLVVGASGVAGLVAGELRRRGRTVMEVDAWNEEAVVDARRLGVALVDDGRDDARSLWADIAPSAVRALGASGADSARFVAITRGAFPADGPATNPASALAAGCALVAPSEYPGLRGAVVDICPDGDMPVELLADAVESADGMCAIRSGGVLAPRLSDVDVLPPVPPIRPGSVYVVTGGLGEIGFHLAESLVGDFATRLAVVTSRPLPEPSERERFVAAHGANHPVVRQIERLRALERAGRPVLTVAADLADPDEVRRALDEVERALGPIDGVVHAAGHLRDRLIEVAATEDWDAVVGPKADAALTLLGELQRRDGGHLVLVSSTSTRLAPPGQAAYVAANAVLDALAGRHGNVRVQTLNYGMWASGMAADAARAARAGLSDRQVVGHPILDSVSVDPRGQVVVLGTLDARRDWVLDEHRTGDGVAVLPGTGQLELMVAAATIAGCSTVGLSAVALHAPIAVDDGRSIDVRVVIEPQPGDSRPIRIESDGGDAGWVLHAEGLLRAPLNGAGIVDTDGLARRCSGPLFDPTENLHRHMHLGRRWSGLAGARAGNSEAFGTISMTDPAEADDWCAHPALVDVATTFAVAVSPHPEHLHVPIGYESVEWFGAMPVNAAVHATIESSGAGLIRADLTVATTAGDVVMRMSGLQLRPLEDSSIRLAALAEVAGDDPPGHAAADDLMDLAGRLGLVAHEGTEWFRRLLSSDVDRITVTSIALDTLDRVAAHAPPPTLGGDQPEPAPPTETSSVEASLTRIWRELLGVEHIDPDDDFFALGGHSLIAIRLMSAINKQFGVRLQLATIFEAPTVAQLAALVRSAAPGVDSGTAASAPSSDASDERHLVPISLEGTGRPLYVVHGAGGNVLFLWTLARALAGERPILGFRAHGVNHGELPDQTVEAIAARYVDELRAHAPGPYLLGGYSGGGVITLEMVRQLQDAGEHVDHVILFDSVPSEVSGASAPVVWMRAARHARRYGWRALKPFARTRLRDALRRYIPERQERQAERDLNDRELGYVDVTSHGYVNLFHYLSATLAAYQTGRYHVDATVLKAELVWPGLPDDYHWSEHIDGQLSWLSVPGDHHSMFYPEHAPRLGRAVSQVLVPLDDTRPTSE